MYFNFSSAALALLATVCLILIVFKIVQSESDDLEAKIVKTNAVVILCFMSLFVGICLANPNIADVFGYCILLSILVLLTIMVLSVGFPKKFKQLLPLSFWLFFLALSVATISALAFKVIIILTGISLLFGLLGCLLNR